jgi:hypothetical protein
MQDQLGQKLPEIPSQPTKSWRPGMHLSYSYARSINRRIPAQGDLSIKARLYLKNN